MLARRMLALLFAEVATYVVLAIALAARGWSSLAILALVLTLHLFVLRGFTVLLGFAIAARVGGRPEPHLGPAARVRLVLGELRAFWLNYVLVPLEPWLPAEPQDAEVVLVHGILCNRAVWVGFRRRLLLHGIRTRALTVEPILGSLDAMAQDLARQLATIQRPVVLVGHSLGGLVARRMLQLRPELRFAGLITIGTPHAGSVQAALAFAEAGRSLRRDSEWLRTLAAAPAPLPALPCVAVYSWHDELVSPPGGCRWPGARELAYRGIGHIELLWSDDVAADVAREIRSMLDSAQSPSSSRLPGNDDSAPETRSTKDPQGCRA
jgi:pimeloyl-ACP methyl ester carboxylesterase